MATAKNTEVPLNFLTTFITESFDGDPKKLRNFITQGDDAFKLAEPHQAYPLLVYVKSRITGKARQEIDTNPKLDTWIEVRELLIAMYGGRKLKKLSCTKQAEDDELSQLYQRFEKFKTSDVNHNAEDNQQTLSRPLPMIKNIAPNRLDNNHTRTAIPQMLRNRELRNINSTVNAQENASRLNYEELMKCRICGLTNHATDNCYKYPPNRHIRNLNDIRFINASHVPTTSTNLQARMQPVKQCRYCKKFGHTIQECWTLQSKNLQLQNQQEMFNNTNQNRQNLHLRRSRSLQFLDEDKQYEVLL